MISQPASPAFFGPDGWLAPAGLEVLREEGTTAHRVWTGRETWIERFGDDFLISAPSDEGGMTEALIDWCETVGLAAKRVFARRLVKQPGESDAPRLVAGPASSPTVVQVRERGLNFEIDFSAGYSVGLFCDQRENRRYLESLRPRRFLNLFAYTCAFSVAAARAGAETVSIDLARRALTRGKRNFELNFGSPAGHRFLADDVFAAVPRLVRRGEAFDLVVIDPPTFSRGEGGRVFRAEEHFPDLVQLVVPVLGPGGRLLLSTNCRTLSATALASVVNGFRRDHRGPVSEIVRTGASATVWLERAID